MDDPLRQLVRRRLSRADSGTTPASKLAREDMPQDAQRYARSAVFLQANVASGGQVTDCDVLNISAGGALIRCEQGLPIDGPFEITIADYPPLTAQIVRTHQDNHGIAFDGDAKEIANLVDEILLDAPHHRDKRSFPRRLVLLAASFYLGDEFVKCKVQNISAGGFFAKSDNCPEAGTTIEFNLARFGTMPVRVIWANERAWAACFSKPRRKLSSASDTYSPASLMPNPRAEIKPLRH